MGPLATSNTPSSIAGGGHVSTDCSGCGEKITDRFILQVAGSSWHGHCLRCCICHTLLDGHASCFLREEQLYCKLDYTKLFGAKCYKCARMISPADWVRKAKDQVRLNHSRQYSKLRKSARVTQSQNVPVSCFSQPIGQWPAQAA